MLNVKIAVIDMIGIENMDGATLYTTASMVTVRAMSLEKMSNNESNDLQAVKGLVQLPGAPTTLPYNLGIRRIVI